jgi:hypothetical protein
LVRIEASTKSPIYNLIYEFLINMAFTMAYPNFKKGLKMAFGPLGVKKTVIRTHNSKQSPKEHSQADANRRQRKLCPSESGKWYFCLSLLRR